MYLAAYTCTVLLEAHCSHFQFPSDPIVHQEEEMDDSVVMNCSNLRKHWCMVSCCNKGVSLLMLSDRFLHFLFHAFLFIVIQIGRT